MAEAVEMLKGEMRRAHQERRADRKNREMMSRRGVKLDNDSDFVRLEEVKPLAEAVKRKGHMDVEVLVKLQKALLQGNEFVSAFLSVSGAFAGIVRDFSGVRPNYALRAAFCLCNLSVNTKSLSWRQTKAVAPYLMVHLDGMNSQMLDACAWAVGNLSLVDEQSWEILHELGALQKLVKLLNNTNEAVVTSAVYSLTHITEARIAKLNQQELKDISSAISPQTLAACDLSRLIFQLSTTGVCDLELSSPAVVNAAILKLQNHLQSSDLHVVDVLSEVTFLIRYLANVSSTCPSSAHSVLTALVGANINLLNSSFPHLQSDFSWLIANLLKHPCEETREEASKCLLKN
ncbi:uncharacterized protein LOC132201689 [Neocloeon triangulifer]|uniref:uncharacterized protein LOC132201689 n=1 Tax=Neocloeon triangulifer TaxID=2078957 RepID=UPI00286F12D6|nr:uncharacterized protein LOC132201689 [Neocloeon triangulifer]